MVPQPLRGAGHLEDWLRRHHEVRSHASLNDLTPWQFVEAQSQDCTAMASAPHTHDRKFQAGERLSFVASPGLQAVANKAAETAF